MTAEVRRYAAEDAERSFAGLWVDRAEGVVHVGFAGDDADGHARRLRQRVARPERVRTFEARFSLRELERIRATIDRHELGRRGLEFSALSIDPRTNSVAVHLANPSRRAERVLADLYGPAVRLVPKRSRFKPLDG